MDILIELLACEVRHKIPARYPRYETYRPMPVGYHQYDELWFVTGNGAYLTGFPKYNTQAGDARSRGVTTNKYRKYTESFRYVYPD